MLAILADVKVSIRDWFQFVDRDHRTVGCDHEPSVPFICDSAHCFE
jgi:hypothetical protein